MKIAVSVVTFSKSEELVRRLKKEFPSSEIKINSLGRRYTYEELKSSLKDADAAIIGLDKIDEGVLSHCPNLRIIVKHGIGTDKIDFEACRRYGVEVRTQEGTNRRAVAELTLGFMLGLMRGSYISSLEMKEGIWNKYNNHGRNLTEKIIGIIGVGNIGKDLVSLLSPFNCTILANDIREDLEQRQFYQEHNLIESSKEEIYRQADIITIHTPLTKLTQNLITRKQFKMMKPTSYLVNTARGEIVNEGDLLWALKNRIIAGAGLDAYSVEPPRNLELLSLGNVFCTPHIGGTSQEASFALGITAIKNLREYFGK